MPQARSNSPGSDYFNDLSQNAGQGNRSPQSPREDGSPRSGEAGENYVPRPKRIACILCRKRKLRCDGAKPSCATCSRLGHDCAYDEVRKKSGPKRGYVKLLEARLKQVETLLGTQAPGVAGQNIPSSVPDVHPTTTFGAQDGAGPGAMPGMIPNADYVDPGIPNIMNDFGMSGMGSTDDFPWELMSLGLEEPLPPQDTIDDMTQLYWEKIHPSLPIIHRPRFLAAMDLAPHMRPPICLRYAMWTNVCSITSKYSQLTEHFYARARKYAESDEMRGHGEGMITLAHAQAWSLIAAFEFKMMYFPRAWMSCGRATRLSQMMGLHRQDGVGLDVKQCLPPPRDWTEREERRRTFWMAFCQDRYASIGTGWPMTIDEQDILTNLPATEEAFNKSKPERTLSLADAMTADGASTLSPFAGVVLMACLFGRNLTHLHRPNDEEKDNDLNGDFWKRHRALDNILLNTSLSLPAQLRLPAGITDANIVFCNMNIHTSTICLHQAAIFKADKNRMPTQISAESKRRCIIAADQITNIMKMISHIDLSTMNPFIAFCLYVAARVFVQYLKSRKDDATVKSSLHFLLSAMQALKSKNPLTESFLVQLDVDLEGSGLQLPAHSKYAPTGRTGTLEVPANHDTVKCSPLFEIRESQTMGQNGPAPPPPEHGSLRSLNDSIMDFGRLGSSTHFGHNPNLPNRQRTSPQPAIDPSFTPNTANAIIYGDPQSMDVVQELSSDSRKTSDHPTPSTTSAKGSSHTSFTPPHFDDSSTSTNPTYPNSSSSAMSPAGHFFQNADPFAAFTMPAQQQPKTPPVGLQNPFSYPSSWDYSHDGPANTGTGRVEGSGQQQQHTGLTPQASTGLTPGPSGMTPIAMPDGSWQLPGGEGNEWMATMGSWGYAPTPQG